MDMSATPRKVCAVSIHSRVPPSAATSIIFASEPGSLKPPYLCIQQRGDALRGARPCCQPASVQTAGASMKGVSSTIEGEGCDVTEKLSSAPAHSFVWLVLYTASDMSSFEANCTAVGPRGGVLWW